MLLAVVLWSTLAFVLALGDSEGSWARYLGLIALPRLNVGIALGFGVVLGAALFYGVPLERLPKAVLFALTAYLLAYTMIVDQLSYFWPARALSSNLDALTWNVILLLWVRESWRSEPPLMHPEDWSSWASPA